MTILERIKKIGERWFLSEPLLFAVYCSHSFVENNSMDVPMRTGNRRIEYAPKFLEKINDISLAAFLKIEAIRILLKHPYQRQPPFASKALLAMASNVTIDDVYGLPATIKRMMGGLESQMPHGLCFEEYYSLLKGVSNSEQGGDSDEQSDGNESGASVFGKNNSSDSLTDGKALASRNAQLSELWEDDEEACCDINGIIENNMECDSWGSIPATLQGLIKASLNVEMDYRKMLSLFKTSVISSKRHLTRMRPNRRFGFDAMGSRYELSTNMLVAVDVSGSVSNKSLSYFFSVINRLFKYGVQKLDVIQFDAEIKGEPEAFKKARKSVKIVGRGGTSFQPTADYYCEHPEYDGLIYFTDGYAPPPVYKTKRTIDVLWVLCGKSAYEDNCGWIKKLKRNRVTFIPRTE